MKNTTKIIAAAALFAAGIFNTGKLSAEAPLTTGENVDFTAQEDSTYKNITFQAYGAGGTSGTVTLTGKNCSKFTDSTKIVAGYNTDRTNFAIDSNNGTGTVNLNGTNTFSGNLEIKASTITSSGSSAKVNLSGVNAKFGAEVNEKIYVYISDTTSIGKLGGGQVVLNGDTYLLNGTTLTAGTNVAANLKSIEDGKVTLEGGAKLNSMNLLNLMAATLTLTGSDTKLTTNPGAGAYIDTKSTLTIEDGAKLESDRDITNDGTMNVQNGSLKTNGKIINNGTMKLSFNAVLESVITNKGEINVAGSLEYPISINRDFCNEEGGMLNINEAALINMGDKKITNKGTINLKGGRWTGDLYNTATGSLNFCLDGDLTPISWAYLKENAGTLGIIADNAKRKEYFIAAKAQAADGVEFTIFSSTDTCKVTVGGKEVLCGGKIYSLEVSPTEDKLLDLIIKDNIEVTVSDAGYATVYSDLNLEVPSGVEVYAYTAKQDTTLVPGNAILKGTILPGGQGYVVKADKGKYIFKATKDKAAAITSILKGTIRRIVPESGTYVLSNGLKGVGFYPYQPATISEKLSAGKAYYRMDN